MTHNVDPQFLRVSFEPGAVRDHYEADDDDPELKEILSRVSDQQLAEAALMYIDSDPLWRLFDELCEAIIQAAEHIELGQARTI